MYFIRLRALAAYAPQLLLLNYPHSAALYNPIPKFKSMPASLALLLSLLPVLLPLVAGFSGCLTESPNLGCLTCPSPAALALNISENRYTCTGLANCAAVSASGCAQCSAGWVLDRGTGQCVQSLGCVRLVNGTCEQCMPGWVASGAGCWPDSVPYCRVYTLDNATNTTSCEQCQHPFMSGALNCTVPATLCRQFDYPTLRCLQCPPSTINLGQYCMTPIQNCISYTIVNLASVCLLCRQDYMIINGTTCSQATPNQLRSQLLIYYYNKTAPEYIGRCLVHTLQYTNSTCISTGNNVTHCLVVVNVTVCQECLPGYYLLDNQCLECSAGLPYCESCSSAQVCLNCSQGYYLQTSTLTTTTKCMPCSAFGCDRCSSTIPSNDGKVYCLSCPGNATLFKGFCYRCDQPGSAYSIAQQACTSCRLLNCISCAFGNDGGNSVTCLECSYNHYYNPTSKTCDPLTNGIVINANTDIDAVYEILRKSLPGTSVVLQNDKVKLMSTCDDTDGYVCICSTTNTQFTSLCALPRFVPDISGYAFDTLEVSQNPQLLRMASELSSFTTARITFTTAQLFSADQFWSILAAYTSLLTREQASTDTPTSTSTSILTSIYAHAVAMGPVFSDQSVTILTGNGFYFKYMPRGMVTGAQGDDDFVTTTLAVDSPVVVFGHFNRFRLSDANVKELTGTIYVFTEATGNFTVSVRKTRYADTQSNLLVRYSGATTNTTVSLSNGYLVIPNFLRSTLTQVKGAQVLANVSATAVQADPYFSARIENIFYSQSWLYILFFVALYLVFIPLCSIVDCCEAEQQMRKKVETSENEKQSEEETVVKVNYRDFFPIYNVGNSPRPGRLRKVCLFIVNMQHIVTFLTLIYFNLASGQPVVAILLAIPAYLCTVVMGYILGALFRLLPGNFKYFVNVFSLGYWVIWIVLMRIMNTNSNGQGSREYRPYILVFSIISFFVDLLFDWLEALLVYFAIAQKEKQVGLFMCLARWLSLRGYYQFDRLAKQIRADE